MQALANWLWQGCAVTLVAAALLRLVPRTTATARYRLWWIAMALVLAVPFAAMVPSFADLPANPPVSASAVESQAVAVVLPVLPWWTLALLMGIWAAWVSVSLVRVASGLIALRRTKGSCRSFPGSVEARLPIWTSLRIGPRRCVGDLRGRSRCGSGTWRAGDRRVAGYRGRSPARTGSVLVHVGRTSSHETIGRFVQVLVTTIAGLHPAVWWIDRRLHLERETACDDWTVNITGSPKRYAECLAKLASLGTGRDAMLVPAIWSSSTFTTRIVRLLDRGRNTSTARRLPSLAVMSSLLTVTALIAAGFELVVSKPFASETAAPTVADVSRALSQPPALVTETLRASANGTVAREIRRRPPVSKTPARGPIVAPVAVATSGTAPADPAGPHVASPPDVTVSGLSEAVTLCCSATTRPVALTGRRQAV